jgi:hypothetical protein
MDEDIARHISGLVEEEHRLHRHTTEHPAPTDEDRQRLQELEVQLDQCWDLLRQRRARRASGQPVEDAGVRPPGVVEGYQQ